jgi:uncharacterized protein YggT (Ycf19 family)
VARCSAPSIDFRKLTCEMGAAAWLPPFRFHRGLGPMTFPLSAFPWWVLVIDYVLGLVMWTLIGRAAMRVFLPENSPFFFSRILVTLTNPVIRFFRLVTPGFLIEPLVPLYVAWFFFMARFYLMPWLLGYSVMGMLSFPLEGEIAQLLRQIFTRSP